MQRSGHLRIESILTYCLIAAAFAAAGCGRGSRSAADASTPPDSIVTGTTHSADGLRIAYEVRGAGDPALVFVHGWSCNRGYWDPQLRYFARTHRVAALDLGGHGASDTARAKWTVEAYADDVAAVVRALDLRDVVLVGHSVGGPIVVEAARRLKGRVRGIIGADTFQDVGEKLPESERVAFVGGFHRNFAAMTRSFVLGMFPQTADSALVARVVDGMSSANSRVGAGSMDEMFLHDLPAALRDMRLPIRAINCDRWPTNVEANRRLCASFEVDIMPGLGHFVMLEDSTGFNQRLEKALRSFGKPQ